MSRFAFVKHRDARFLWRIGADDDPKEISCKDACVEKLYYKNDNVDIECELSRVEAGIPSLLTGIEEHGVGDGPSTHIWNFVHLLAHRGCALRSGYAEVMDMGRKQLEDLIGQPSFERIVLASFKHKVETAIRQHSATLPVAQRTIYKARSLRNINARIAKLQRSPGWAKRLARDAVASYKSKEETLLDAKSGHIELLRGFLLEDRTPVLPVPVRWAVHRTQETKLMFADNPVVGVAADGRVGSIWAIGESASMYLLPISPVSYLCGYVGEQRDAFSGERLNTASASIAYKYIFGTTLPGNWPSLRAKIGERWKPVTAERCTQMLAQAVVDWLRASTF